MIIACPACATRYVVPDSAIGVEGRTVRCAKCRHSWFQDGPELALSPDLALPPETAAVVAPPPAPPPPAAAPPAPEPEQFASPPPAAAPEPEPEVAPPPPVAETHEPEPAARPGFSAFDEENERDDPPPSFVREPDPVPAPPPVPEYDGAAEESYSQFDPEPPFRPRRNVLKLWTYAAVVFALFAIGTVMGVSYWGLPDWVPVSRPTFGLGQSDLVLDFPQGKQDRRQLPNGTEFFGASGTVTNVGSTTRKLPPILIVLRDERDRIVYSWEVAPPQRTLAPGESVTINQAVPDVPKAAKFAEIGWKPG